MEWPDRWMNTSLERAGIPVTTETLTIMRAWKTSTPLPPYTNNPIGFPAGTLGAKSLLTTRYALFLTMDTFYAALAALVRQHPGRMLVQAMTSDNPYPATWRVIHGFKWPGSDTETDYPSALLDLTTQAYRDSVGASSAGARRTSGVIGASTPITSPVIDQARSLADVASTVNGATEQVRELLRRHGTNG